MQHIASVFITIYASIKPGMYWPTHKLSWFRPAWLKVTRVIAAEIRRVWSHGQIRSGDELLCECDDHVKTYHWYNKPHTCHAIQQSNIKVFDITWDAVDGEQFSEQIDLDDNSRNRQQKFPCAERAARIYQHPLGYFTKMDYCTPNIDSHFHVL